MTTNTKISTIVSNQLPEFVRADHPTFVSFLEAYYEYLEQSNNTLSYGKTVERAKNLRNYFDIDKIDQTGLTEFSNKLYNQFLTFIPQDAKADRSKLLKNIKDFYLGGGTQRSYDFIYRILFGEESSFYYPKDDILRASSGKWYVEKSVRLTDVNVNGVPDDTVESLKKFNATLIRGNTSTSTAQVEKILTTYEGGIRYTEFFLSKQKGSFIPGEPFFAVNVNGDTLSGNLLSGFISTITITDGGSGYTTGTPIVFEGGSGGTGVSAFISNVSLGNVSGTIVLQGGAGFKGSSNGTTPGIPANPVLYTGGFGFGAAGYVDVITANGGFHPTYYRLCVDTIDEYDDVVIGQYSNTSTLGNANTSLTNTWSYVDYGPIGPAVSIEVNEGGSGYTSIPLASIVGNTTLRSLSVPGRLTIIDPGVGYSNGDTIIFANKSGVYGYGANAYVNVDANGAITSYTWRTVEGDYLTGSNTLGTRTEHIGGLAYSQLSLPDISVISTSGGTNAVIAIDGFLGYGESLTSTTGTIGQILNITITNKGYGYTSAPSINLSNSGDGTATAYANSDAGTFTYPGKYLDDTGLISGTNKLEDRDYYQNYSYVVKLRKALNTYRKYIDDLVHPTGTKLWAEFQYKSDSDIDDIVTITDAIDRNYQPYFANSYYFANTNSIIYKNSSLLDTSNSSMGAVSLWFNPDRLVNDQTLFSISNVKNDTQSPRFSIVLTNKGTSSAFSNSVIRIEARDASNVLLMRMESNVRNKIIPNNWIHLLSTWDLSNVTNNRIFLNNVNSTNVSSSWVPTSNLYSVGGYISGINILNGGQGYNANAALVFTNNGGANATYTIANSLNSSESYSTNARQNTISTITINNRGSRYNASGIPLVTANKSNISPASFAVTLGDGYIRDITIVSGGQGYNANGSLIFTGGGGSGAAAYYNIANVLGGATTSNAYHNTIVSITVTNPGSGYTSRPTITAQGANITSATFSTNVVSSVENTPTGIFFRPDGTSMFIVGHDRANISQYNLSTPWNVSTAKFVYATANVELSYVTDIRIISGGTGYNANGSLVFSDSSGTGTVATYTAKGNGKFTGIHIGIPPAASGTSPGKGYSNGFLTITDAGDGVGANIQFSVNPVSGAIVAINVKSAGHNYDPISPPTILPPPQNLANIQIDVQGTGYSNGGYLIIIGGNGSGANATYEVGALGNINKIIFANTGSGYTTRPTITAQGANTSPASFTAIGIAQLTAELSSNATENIISSITVTSKGAGYNILPTVTASGSNISPAVFLATMEGPNPGDLYVKSDGTRVYVIDETLAKVLEYEFADAWNLKSISVSSNSLVELNTFSVADRATNTHGLHFSSTGNSMYITCSANAKIYQYTLSTNWNVSTASYTSNLYIGNIETSPQSIMFDNTGIRMYVTGFSAKGVSEYRLESPWNITTARHYINHTTDNEESQPKSAYVETTSGIIGNISTPITSNNLYVWGYNSDGQLGDGTTTDSLSPIQIGSDYWIDISSGSAYTSLAIKSDGTLWAWGYNGTGQFGDGTTTDSLSPIQIGSSTWKKVSVGDAHTLAIKSDGTLWAWGDNSNSQLGDGTTTNRLSPVQIGSSTWIDIAAGASHSLGIKSDGTLWAWGGNSFGQIGDGTTTNRLSPVQIGSSTWNMISAGAYGSGAIKSDGTLWAWGGNSFGQIGDGTTTNRLSPVQIGSSTWNMISCGYSHTTGIKSDNTLWAWGGNSFGQIGDGTTTNRLSPVQIGSSTWNVVNASTFEFTVAIKLDGTLWSWGYNGEGELGDGTTTNRLSPVQIGSSTWSHISSHGGHTLAFEPEITGTVNTAIYKTGKLYIVGDTKSNVLEYYTTETGAIDYTAGNVTVSGTAAGNDKFVGCLSELWFSNNYLNHTNTALMNKFNSANGDLFPTNLMVHISPEWSYTGNSFNVRAYEEDPRGVFFKPDGKSMYVIGYVNANISKYNLSTPWDVNTATFIVNTANVGICDSGSVDPNDIFIKNDGTRLYIIYNRESKVKQFDMSQAWNVLSISVAAGGFLSNTGEVNVAIQESNTSGLHFSNNGTYMYVTGTGTDKVHQYTLSESWNVSTASYTQNVNVFVQTTETQPTGLAFNENGTKMFITGSTQDSIYEFNLTTPWNILTSSYVKRHSEYIQDTAMTGLYYDSSNGAFIIGSTKDTIFKYNVNSEIYTSIYLKGNVALANVNYGRGGNFNYANSIVTCNTSPSDT